MSFWRKKNKTTPTEPSDESAVFVESADGAQAPEEGSEERWRFSLKRPKIADISTAIDEGKASDLSEHSSKAMLEKEESDHPQKAGPSRDRESEESDRHNQPTLNSQVSGVAEVRSVKKQKRLKGRGGEAIAVRPIKALMGFLPEVSYKDAKEYAQGIAEKHFEQIGLAYFEAFKYKSGYVYEAHEGGGGKAFAPAIIKYFDTLGEYKAGERHSVVLPTSTRMLEVERTREGLVAIMLPESSDVSPTEWLHPEKSMTPGLHLRTSFLLAAGVVFITGVIAMLSSGVLFRIQPYDVPLAPPEDRVSVASLPLSQWARIERVTGNFYVTAIKFENNKWLEPILVQEEVTAPSQTLPAGATDPAIPAGGQAIGQPSPLTDQPVLQPPAAQAR